MTIKRFAVSPIDFHGVTKGKRYPIKSHLGEPHNAFTFDNDYGFELYCLYQGCAHIETGVIESTDDLQETDDFQWGIITMNLGEEE